MNKRSHFIGMVIMGLLPVSMMEAMRAEDVAEEVIESRGNTFILLRKTLGPAQLKAVVKVLHEGRRRGESKYFSAFVPELEKEHARNLNYLNEVRVKQNFICLQNGDSWVSLDYDAQKEYSCEAGTDGLIHAVVDGNYLILLHHDYYRVISLIDSREIYKGPLKGEIRVCKAGKLISMEGVTISVQDVWTGSLIEQIALPSLNYDIAMTSSGAIVCRGFTIESVPRGESTDYVKRNDNNFIIWNHEKKEWDKISFFEDSKRSSPFKLYILGDKILTLYERLTPGPNYPLSVLMGESIIGHQLAVRDDKGALLSTFEFPRKGRYTSFNLRSAGICIDETTLVVSVDDAVHLCNLHTGDMKALPHKGAYLCHVDKQKIISGSRKGTVCIWDRHSGDLLVTYTGVTPLKKMVKANFFNVSADGRQLIMGRQKGVTLKYCVLAMPISFIDDCNAVNEATTKEIIEIAKNRKSDKKRAKCWKLVIKRIYH